MMRARRGEVWLADLEPVAGHEQGGTRPCVVVSSDAYNRLMFDMVVIIPLTTRNRRLAHQPRLGSPSSGLAQESFARPEDVLAISANRLRGRLGYLHQQEFDAIAATLRVFLDL